MFLVVDGPLKIYQLWRVTAANFEAQLAVVATAKNITRPLFQDYSREGRLIGIFLRLGRILVGILIQVLLVIVFAAIIILWLLLPLYIVYQLFSNLIVIFGLA